jgi:hypothetical protein
MKSKALIMATLFAIFFAWSCKKEDTKETSYQATTTPMVPTSGTGQLKSTEVMVWSDSLRNSDAAIYAPNYMRGESFKTPGIPGALGPRMKITSIKVWLRKVGNPTGTVKVQIFNTNNQVPTGVQKPTGNAIATSNPFDVSLLSTTSLEKLFTFSGSNQYLTAQNRWYFAVVYYNGGNVNNCIRVSMNDYLNTEGNHVQWALSMPPAFGWVVKPMLDMSMNIYAIQ